MDDARDVSSELRGEVSEFSGEVSELERSQRLDILGDFA
jgi:hypothetical protein